MYVFGNIVKEFIIFKFVLCAWIKHKMIRDDIKYYAFNTWSSNTYSFSYLPFWLNVVCSVNDNNTNSR